MGWAVAPLVSLAISVGSQLLLGLFQKSPKQEDPLLQMPKSDYGIGIPKIYGRVRLEGNKFFPQTNNLMYEIRNERSGRGGGKGGGGTRQREKKVYGSVALMYCEGKANLEKIIIQGEHIETDHAFFQQYCTWFDGTQDSVWSVVSQDEEPYRFIKYKGVAFLGIEKMPLDRYGNQIPSQISAVLVDDQFGTQPTLTQVVGDILTRAEIDNSLWDVTDLNGIRLRDGIAVKQSGESYQETIESLMELYLFAPYQNTDGKLIFRRIRRGDNSVLSVDNRFLIPSDNGNSYITEIKSDFELPTKLSIKFYNNSRVYESDEVNVFLGNKAEKDNNVKTLPEILFTYPYEAEERSREILSYLYSIEKNSYVFKLPIWYYSQFNCLDVLTLPNGQTVQITKMTVGADYTVEITANFYDSVSSTYISTPDTAIPPPVFPDPTIPDIFFIDAPVIDNDIPGSLYCFATSGPATIQFSDNGGDSWDVAVNHLTASTIGNCFTVLGSTVNVEIISGSDLESITDNEFNVDMGQNLCFIGKQTAQGYYEGEFLQYRDVAVIGTRQFTLSTLKTGLNNTANYVHTSGEKFFLFKGSGSYYSVISGNASNINKPTSFRAVVSEWQNLATTPIVTLTPKGNAFKPSSPTNATGSIDEDGNISIFWDYSAPFSPYNNSTEAVTYDVVIVASNRLIQSNTKQCNYLIADRTTDGVGTTFDVLIYAVSSVVGRGNPLSATIVPVLLPNEVIGTGGGLRGIKRVTSAYTVTEHDVGFVIVVQTNIVEEINITFPSSLSNGFYCYVVNDRNNNRSAIVSIVVPNSYTFVSNNRIPNGKVRSVIHVSLGNFFIEGENSLFFDYVGDVANNGVLDANIWYEMQGNRTFLLPTNPREGNMIGIRGMNGVDFANTPITINGNGELIEDNATLVMNQTDERIILYFNGLQWIFISRYVLSSGGGSGGGASLEDIWLYSG